MTRFFVGGYGPEMDGTAQGVGVLRSDEGRGPTTLAYRGIAALAASPSWLATHPTLDVSYAALEDAGTVQAFARTGEETLTPLGAPVAAGAAVCHLAVTAGFLVASCYGDGRVVRIPLDAAGVPGVAVVADAAEDPHGPDGRDSHAHSAAFLPDGRIATTDLGFDLVRIWRPTAGRLQKDHEVVLPKGTGPRHMVVHPSGHLHVVTEYSCEIFTLAAGRDGRWSLVGGVLSSPAAQVGFDFPAELARSRDGETLYTALRGSNTIAALRVRGGGDVIESLALVDSGVDWPRHHLVYDGTLLVAGQRSDTVAAIDLDARTGIPGSVRHRAAVPAPTHILPA